MWRRVLLTGLMLLVLARAAEAQQCLHAADESASERARREAAVAFVDRLNAAQKNAQATQGAYVALSDAVSLGDVPLGFVPRLTFDRWSYAVSLKDLFDPCGFALFSDQDGVVYEARPAARGGDASASRSPVLYQPVPAGGEAGPLRARQYRTEEHGRNGPDARGVDSFEHPSRPR